MNASIRLCAPLLVLTLFAGQARLSAQQPPPAAPFTIEIPVLVLDHQGQPVLQLDQDQFRVSDNGRPQRVLRFERDVRPVSLAVVIDTGDPDAIAQAKRSAELLADMVMGAAGEASVYISGPDPHQVLPFTTDHDQVVNTLRHLTQTPSAPQGQGMATEPASVALLDLSHKPSTQARAVLIVSKDAARSGPTAHALVEDAMEHAISIFRIAPKLPDGATPAVNPDTVAAKGAGAGSQRDPNVIPSAPNRGAPGTYGTDVATINLTPIPAAAKHLAGDVVVPHDLDYVFDSGGLTLGSGDNADFDRKLSSIGADLRSLYRLYYHPDDLAAASRQHQVSVTVLPLDGAPHFGQIEYRRFYLGPPPR